MHLNKFLVKISLCIWFNKVLNFFTCICKIICKPMGIFAKNLNLGTHFLPPLPRWTCIFYSSVYLSIPLNLYLFRWQRYTINNWVIFTCLWFWVAVDATILSFTFVFFLIKAMMSSISNVSCLLIWGISSYLHFTIPTNMKTCIWLLGTQIFGFFFIC